VVLTAVLSAVLLQCCYTLLCPAKDFKSIRQVAARATFVDQYSCVQTNTVVSRSSTDVVNCAYVASLA